MAITHVTTAGTLVIPGSYSTISVETSNSGLATSGVLMLVGEADAGPVHSLETDLSLNAFGPDQLADVVAKYKSGALVDAFRGAQAASNDTNIQGSFSRAYLVKTNSSSKASATLSKHDGSSWSTINDRSYGKLGNLISAVVTTKQAEVVPTTGSFAYLPAIGSTNISVRVNGGAATAITLAAQATPVTFKTAMDAVPGVDVSGGVDLEIMGTSGTPLAGNLTVAVVTGNTITVSFSVPFGAIPAVGSTLWIPAGSAIAGASSANIGSYVVSGASASVITAVKKLNATGSPNALTAPVAVASTAATGADDVYAFSPVSVFLVAANPTEGLGKSLEIAELTTGVGLLSYLCWTMGTLAPEAVTWISTAAAPQVITSATEYIPLLTAAREIDGVSEELTAGGAIAMAVGYTGTSGTLVNNGTTITITVVGGSGTSPAAISLADYPTIASLTSYLASLTGFVAAPGTAIMGQQPSSTLDQGTFTIGTTHGAKAARIKQDAYKFFNKVSTEGVLVQISADGATQPIAGTPGPTALRYLSGGTRGATTDALFNSAVDALEMLRGNFLVPLFSRNSTSDIADNLTDAASSYTIANIHSYCRAHVLKMSTQKRRRNRQAFLSISSTLAVAKETSANLANYRCAMTFQDVKDTGANGIFQFQPWMGAVKAASMQAAGLYRPIVHKFVAVSGALSAAGDFNDQDDSKMEDALLAGLLPIRRDETGGYYWVSDQTTYGKDSNFVYNSIQGTYVADIIALSTAQRMERMFVGQSVADVSAVLAKAALETILDGFLRLKLIAGSSDATAGYKDAKVVITGSVMKISVNVKLAGAILFVPIAFTVSQVTQSA